MLSVTEVGIAAAVGVKPELGAVVDWVASAVQGDVPLSPHPVTTTPEAVTACPFAVVTPV